MAFITVNGQIYTPGLAIINAPQPYTPLGGETLQISIDVSGNGQLSLSPEDDAPTLFHDLTIFLTSTETEKNLTISNGTTTTTNSTAYIGPVLDLEPSSTVKHINWIWPECFVGEGDGDGDSSSSSARGNYNISMHQSFRWNGTEYYTVFDLPISVSNGIEEDEGERVDCAVLENEWRPGVSAASNGSLLGQPWVDGDGGNVVIVDNEEEEEDGGGSGGGRVKGVGVLGWVVVGLVMGGVIL
ncbi:hypothetical protein BDW59DRAFT_160969 [Aspergillus cavernicola]|uniref:Uncharacterized protein n=1 Tax=Aspergillus cavernicola TaxID=176166 RepID=A0ABR4IFC6_9EURO